MPRKARATSHPLGVPPTMSAKERLAQRAGEAEPPPSTNSKKVRQVLELTDEEKSLVDEYLSMTAIEKEVKGLKKDGLVRGILKKKVIADWVAAGRKTENPLVQGEHSKCLFVCADSSGRLKVGTDANGKARLLQDRLKEENFPAAFSEEVCKHVKQKEIQTILSPDEIEGKHPELAEKIRCLLLDNLTVEETKIVVKNDTAVEVEPGFVDNIAKYAVGRNNDEKADMLLRFIESTKIVIFRIDDAESHDYNVAMQQLMRKLNIDLKVAPTATAPEKGTEKEFVTDDKLYRIIVKDNMVTLFRLSGSGVSEKVGIKKCNDAGHALNTARKWMRDRETLETAEEEMES